MQFELTVNRNQSIPSCEQALAVDSDGPLTAQDFWANRGKRDSDYTRQKMWVRPNSMMTTYSAPPPGKRGAVLRPNR